MELLLYMKTFFDYSRVGQNPQSYIDIMWWSVVRLLFFDLSKSKDHRLSFANRFWHNLHTSGLLHAHFYLFFFFLFKNSFNRFSSFGMCIATPMHSRWKALQIYTVERSHPSFKSPILNPSIYILYWSFQINHYIN